MKIKLLIFSLLFSVAGWSQILIPNATPVTQNFDGIGASATATLPTGVRVNTTANYTTGTTATTVVYGTTGTGVVTGTSTGGCVNWANGIAASATDRSLGFLSAGSFSSPRSIIIAIQNTGSTNITDLLVSFDYEKSRSGSRAFDWTFFHGATATNVNTAAAAGNQSYAADATNTVVSNPPISVNKSFTLTGLSIAPSSIYYLCWTYTGVGGATNAQGLGLDNLSLTATFAGGCTPPSTQASAISTNTITTDGCNVNWTAGNGNGTMIVVRPTGSANTLPSNGTAYGANLAWGSAGTIDANNRVIFRAAGTTAGPITGLTPGTEYTVTAYEYNTASNCYNLTSPVSTTFYTLSLEPMTHAASFSCSVVSSTQIDFTFSAANSITNGRAYILLQKIGSSPTGLPADGAYYPNGTVIGDATVAGVTSLLGTDTTLSVTGLTPGTNYYFTLIPWDSYLSVPQTINFYTGGAIPSTNCTTSASAVAITSSLTSSSVYGSVYSYSIIATGSPTSYNAVGLPAGLTIDTVTGIISGTPTVGVGAYNIDISATNGTTDTKTLVLTITAKNLTITGVAADNKVYDRTLVATLSGTPTLVGIVGSDVVTVSGSPSPAFGSVVVGAAKPVSVTGYTLSGAQAANYTLTQPTGLTANITAKALTVSGAVANNKVYNGTTTATITGASLVGVIASDVVNITPSGTFLTANVGTAIAVTSTSSISGADSSNYSLTQPTGLAADITQASQTITFNPLVIQYTGAANFNLTATASSGLTVTYVSSNPAVATVSGNTVTIVGVGTTIITASQVGNGNYAAAVDVNQNQVVTNAPCLNDSFTSATFPPVGWLATTVTRSTTAADYVTGPAAATFASNNGSLTTSMVANPAQLRFYLGRSANVNAKTLTVEVSTTSQVAGFTTVATYDHTNVPSASYNQYTVDLSAYTIYPNVWIRFVKTSGTTAPWRFDDLEVFCGTVWNGSAWSNGVPNLTSVAVINGNYNTTTNGDIDSSSLIVNSTFTTTVTPNHYINIQNNLTVNGILDVQDNGSLVQISDAGVNTGNIFMKRIATIKKLDYVFWSSPVANFAVTAISPATPIGFNWKWNPSISNTNNGFGNWQNANENMSVGKGYIVRGPNGFDNVTAQDLTVNFVGVPNNGIKDVNIERGNFTGIDYTGTNGTLITKNEDNWNLIGNPYPSAISAKDFMTLNANIEGSVRLWTHGTLPNTSAANPFYNSYVYNYSATDYLIYNLTGTQTQSGFDGYIGAGQSFFVLMNDGAAATETVRFQNSLRSKAFRNDQFYKNANSQNATNNIERHRIWVDLISSTGTVNRTLVGYIEGATQDKDRLYDAYSDHKSAQDFYSVINNEALVIQGRALPFVDSDLVPMGVKIPADGTYTIAIAALDGLFSGNAQTIYLEDKLLNTIHDLSVAPYQFTATKGIVDTRFVLRYTNQTLGNNDFELIENNVKVFASGNAINMDSKLENIKNYTVFNVLGQTLASKNNVNAHASTVHSIMKNNQTLIVKLTLENGQIVTKKIIF